ncbi:MAG: UvrD-helicase domain-containing protein [Clostridiales bacterium]
MYNQKESAEKKHLEEVQAKLKTALEQIIKKVDSYFKEILEAKRYINENLAQLDSAEKAANRMIVSDSVTLGENAVKERERLQKLLQSPYFGRIDFDSAKGAKAEVFYIGIHGFAEPLTSHPIIFDWRAPVSSMFYDFEVGPAFYVAPMGKIDGVLTLKRQYRIRQGQMEYMLENSLNIGDEILQKELSRNSGDKMKNIVATIQREQNAVIRNEEANVLIIQGAAGSGKTSIALHRVAFLLYRNKDTLTSKNILIFSPNKVFGNYIANVLPELGEEHIEEIGVDDIASSMLGKKYRYQTFFEQVESLLDGGNAEAIARIQFKATNHFVEVLHRYLEYIDENGFTPADFRLGNFHVSKEKLFSVYRSLKKLPIKKRLRKMAEDLIEKHQSATNTKIAAAFCRQIRDAIQNMFQFADSFTVYQNFYRFIGQDHLFQLIRKNTFEFCDVYPFIYVKIYVDGAEQDFKNIRHLLVDEMQDYTPIQYAVLSKLFSCKMTILGDSYQSVNPYSSSSAEKIRPYFGGCHCMELSRSYRSTLEIVEFTQRILKNEKLLPMERHGDIPTVTICQTPKEHMDKIKLLLEQFHQSQYVSLGVICKSQKQAKLLFEELHTLGNVFLLSSAGSEFRNGIVITSVHMSKGLEFDQVIIPDASEELYQTSLDRSLLYIACTRAMHKLDLTCWGRQTKFMDSANQAIICQ